MSGSNGPTGKSGVRLLRHDGGRKGRGVLEIIRGAERGNCGRREGLSCMIKARLEFARFGEEPDDLFETRSLR